MAVAFPRQGNKLWPLPACYHELTSEGQRMARVNAAGLGGRPHLEVARWHFFRETYLMPRALSWYGREPTPSPQSHYQWLYDWYDNTLLIHAAPRGSCKTTVNLEDILSKAVGRPHWTCAMFLATQQFCSDRLGAMMEQIENNDLIIRDFGSLKPSRGSGQWNRGSKIELTNGSKISAKPIMGASAGTRPNGLLVMDDVEDPKDTAVNPADLRENFERFFFHGLYPMSQSPGWSIPIRIIGTLWHRRMFIHWLYKTSDPRVADNFSRRLMTVKDLDWDVWGEEWQEETKKRVGPAAWAAQYMNCPSTDADRLLTIHPELNTYQFDGQDDAALGNPLLSQTAVVSHVVTGWTPKKEGQESKPVTQRVVRPWSEVVAGMRRFIMVDSCRTTTEMSDYSAIHVLGFENTPVHRDTLWSLNAWVGKVTREDLIKRLYEMAVRWHVYLVGVEAYPVLATFYEMARDYLPGLFQREGLPCPRVIPIKFPTSLTKADKIAGMEWRFRQFRVKLPSDRASTVPAYVQLWEQIENFTEDMALLENDDILDTLAMHQAIGKQRKAERADVYKPRDLVDEIRQGNRLVDGIPAMSGVNASDIPDDVIEELLDRQYEDAMSNVPVAADYLRDDQEGRELLRTHGVPIWTP